MKNTLTNGMKFMARPLLALAILFWGTACSERDNKGDQEMKIAEVTKEKVNKAVDATRDAAIEAKQAMSEAWAKFSNYTVDSKDAAADYLDDQVSALDQELADLGEKSKELEASSKASFEKSIESLKEKRADLALQVEKTKNATKETWGEVKLETQKKWNEFSESLRELSIKLKGS